MSLMTNAMGIAKQMARRKKVVGTIEYFWAGKRDPWGGPFNGQTARQALFSAIIANVQPQAIVETGTYFGTTTEFMALTKLPIFTIETDRRYFGYARARFWRLRNITLMHDDSRTALRRLFAGCLHGLHGGTLFFYLDAHWGDDVPLAEEIEIVFHECPSAIVMIDDFQVPADSGYGYDDYGAGKALVPSYIAPAVSAHGLTMFYPSTPAVKESGLRRGCVVLTQNAAHVSVLASLPLLCTE